MRILLLCLNAFETMEASPFIDVFGWARNDFDCNIDVVTCGYREMVKSTFGIPMKVDTLIDEIDVKEYDALAIPGGFEEYGFYEEAYASKTLKLIREFHEADKWIATVCTGAFPVAKSGILEGKRATTYHLRGGYRREELEKMGVVLGSKWLEMDGRIITSSCPRTAPDVAYELLEQLTSTGMMLQVKAAMGY